MKRLVYPRQKNAIIYLLTMVYMLLDLLPVAFVVSPMKTPLPVNSSGDVILFSGRQTNIANRLARMAVRLDRRNNCDDSRFSSSGGGSATIKKKRAKVRKRKGTRKKSSQVSGVPTQSLRRGV